MDRVKDIEGVKFSVAICSKMTRREFINAHIDRYYLNRSKADREKILSDAYSIIIGKTEEDSSDSVSE